MGVLACDRAGCENIMCDICVDGKWYVCNECAAEFARKNTGQHLDIGDKFAAFITTAKPPAQDDFPTTAEQFFKRHRRHH